MAGRVGERRRRAPQLAGVVVRGGADGDAEAAREGGAVGEGRACYRHGRTADARADGGISARHVVRGVVHEFGRGHKLLAVEREVERAAADGAGRRRAIDVGQAVVRHADRRVDVDRVGPRAEEAAEVERAAVRRARAQREVCAARRGAVRRGECVDRRRAEVGEGGGRRRELRAVEADGDGAIAGGGARWRLAAQPTAGVLRRHHRRERAEAAARAEPPCRLAPLTTTRVPPSRGPTGGATAESSGGASIVSVAADAASAGSNCWPLSDTRTGTASDGARPPLRRRTSWTHSSSFASPSLCGPVATATRHPASGVGTPLPRGTLSARTEPAYATRTQRVSAHPGLAPTRTESGAHAPRRIAPSIGCEWRRRPPHRISSVPVRPERSDATRPPCEAPRSSRGAPSSKAP